ncbi:similar to calcium/calmodulin dependent protein kinase [Plenodomus lingam JN3]|uniref:Similar to calcium/calmodulin dependent protein kinase n=1 Tax=Leptosphaeria maculans (strain JN3 / isolate v23.1.3 / race Av1-4-5-6-7-8) TaxID=985895 RepID=E5A3E8_LEPMJ|nr:similar to calcium/calmodulin dependent protein kinase [Plenodomus lingam JN3]CBX98161.1 similar to calcium/calmodulin dependent protein kinase [Plenodomus lingam JN3]
MAASKSLNLEKPHLGRMWLAASGNNEFMLKDIPPNIFSAFNENIRPRLPQTCRIWLPLDTILNQRIFVYEYLDDDFLSLVHMHDRDIVHLDVKPDNILVNYRNLDEEAVIEKVQISDLENAAYLPEPRCIKEMLAGNDNWRSPEGHFKGELNKPSDLHSFGLVCIYAVLGRVILGPDDDFKLHESKGALPAFIRLQRQISYFGDKEGLNVLMKDVGDEEANCEILRMLWEDRAPDYIPYVPFSYWTEVDSTFKDLIRGLNNLDPSQRLTARQALSHPWFEDIETTY